MKLIFIAAVLTLCMVYTFLNTSTGSLALTCLVGLPLWQEVVVVSAVYWTLLTANVCFLVWLLTCSDEE